MLCSIIMSSSWRRGWGGRRSWRAARKKGSEKSAEGCAEESQGTRCLTLSRLNPLVFFPLAFFAVFLVIVLLHKQTVRLGQASYTVIYSLKTSGLYFQVKGKHSGYKMYYIGKLENCEFLNYLITLAKLHTWQSRKQDKIPECEVFSKQVDVIYRTEKYIAVKIYTEKNFRLSGYYIDGTYI